MKKSQIEKIKATMKHLETIPPISYDREMVRISINCALCNLDEILEDEK